MAGFSSNGRGAGGELLFSIVTSSHIRRDLVRYAQHIALGVPRDGLRLHPWNLIRFGPVEESAAQKASRHFSPRFPIRNAVLSLTRQTTS